MQRRKTGSKVLRSTTVPSLRNFGEQPQDSLGSIEYSTDRLIRVRFTPL